MDTENHRKAFFLSYVIANMILLIFGFYMMQKGTWKEQPWIMGCDSMKKEGTMKDIGASNIAECREKLGVIIQTCLGAVFLAMILLQFHFFSVVYTHWKNYSKDKSSETELRHLHDEDQ